jgi:hypothetical protein
MEVWGEEAPMSSAVLVAQEREAPFSCSTNLSNVVLERLRQVKLGSRAMEVCLYLHRQTFGNAGWHRKQGHEEWWCHFDLARWSRVLACEKSNLLRMRQSLLDCHIICFEPDELHPGAGRIGWNLQKSGAKTERSAPEQSLNDLSILTTIV